MTHFRNSLSLVLLIFALNSYGFASNDYVFTFRSSVVYGSQKDDLSMYISTDFKGGNKIEDIRQAKWKEITSMATLSEGSPFISSGNLDFSKLVEAGKPLFIAFKYSAPATPKPTQRMWRITRSDFKHNGTSINLSEWLFINHSDNDENVGWEKMTNGAGIQYRSRMTKKQTESWAIIQILLPNTANLLTDGAAGTDASPAVQKTATSSVAEASKPGKSVSANTNIVAREDLKSAMHKAYLENGPDPAVLAGNKIEVLEKKKEKEYERWHVKYRVDEDEYSYAYILLPLDYAKGGKFPLMLCPHPTYILGKNRVAAMYDEPIKDRNDSLKRFSGQYGLDLVRNGFVVFAPDRAGYGERRLLKDQGFKENMSAYTKKLREKHPKFGINGKAIWDLKVGLDLMLTYNFVDSKNVGIIGHSLGAWDSILLSAMDDRVKATVVNAGGMVAFMPELWADDQTELKSYLASPSKQSLTKNTNIFLMLNSDRSLFYIFSLRDPFYKGQPQLVDGYKTVYEYYKAHHPKKQADISYFLHKDGHTFYPTAKAAAYTWLKERLMAKN